MLLLSEWSIVILVLIISLIISVFITFQIKKKKGSDFIFSKLHVLPVIVPTILCIVTILFLLLKISINMNHHIKLIYQGIVVGAGSTISRKIVTGMIDTKDQQYK